MSKPFFLCLPGSVRRASSNALLLRQMAEEMAGFADARVDEGLGALPIFSPDLEGPATPAEITDLKRLVAEADGLIVACPEYVHGIPGGFKNLIDWLVQEHGFTPTDAYCLVSTCPDFRVNVYQMVRLAKLNCVAGAELPTRYLE